MSSITTDKGNLHHEVYGHGRPVINLHGWLGSWGLWQDMVLLLGQYYRTYALDFWGFGESGRKLNSYQVADFFRMVDHFINDLGLVDVPLVGHSMGGTVSLSVAIQYPERAMKVVVIGSPIAGSSLAVMLKLAGIRWIAWLLFRLFPVFRSIMRLSSPLICHAPYFPDVMDRELSRTALESFLVSIASLRRTDLHPDLHKIQLPVTSMYGDQDIIVHPRQWQPLLAGVPHTRVERFKKAGHFIMLDEPELFKNKLKSFLVEPMAGEA